MRRRLWTVFVACVLVLAGVLGWVTKLSLELQAQQLRTEARADHQEQLRLALWRMDSWLAPRLAREATRPYFEYQPYYAPDRVYDEMLQPLVGTNLPLTPSPLLAPASDEFPLHFQLEADGRLTSPQVPHGEQRSLAYATCTDAPSVSRCEELLRELDATLTFGTLDASVAAAEHRAIALADDFDEGALEAVDAAQRLFGGADTGVASADVPGYGAGEAQDVFSNRIELQKRAQTSNAARSAVGPWTSKGGESDEAASREVSPRAVQRVEVGPLLPVWLAACAGATNMSAGRLVFVRRVNVGARTLLQGFVVDWPLLRASLLDEVGDLLVGASLDPLDDGQGAATRLPGDSGLVLASIPASLAAPLPVPPDPEGLTPVLWSLVFVWAAGAVAVGAVGTTLHASLVLGERKSRFASAVTHELRTPLTTFRLYSEMLASGMVTDPVRHQEYLETLESESERLARLVENVLAYARLEQGRSPIRPEAMSVEGLLARLVPTLERRARDGHMTFAVDLRVAPEHELHTDATVVGQILFNLVDNAAKYAVGADDATITLRIERVGGRLAMSVADHGPGVPDDAARRIFDAFERRGPENVPGVGLGLSLSRGLARELGGELDLLRATTRGACFRLLL